MLATAPRTRSSSIFPLAAICCLLILGFLIAATIVLALIPIYLPSKQATPAIIDSLGDDTFYIRYSSSADPRTSQSGSLVNIAEINQRLRANNFEVTRGFVKATNDRRRRSLVNRRQKRDSKREIALECKYKGKPSCNRDHCKKKFKDDVEKEIKDRGNIDNFPCEILTGGKVTRIQISITLVSVIVTNFAEALLGFGEVISLTIYAVKSGFAYDPATWLYGVVPFAGCSVVVPVGITVFWARPVLTFPLEKILIYGTIAFGSGFSSFTFNFPVKIDCRSGGQIQDLTGGKLLILAESSLLIVRSGGSFAAVGTVIRISTSTGPGSSVTVDKPSGPYTCAALPGGSIVSYPKIAFIVIRSGGILSSSCYLNDEAPSPEECESGCAVYVSPGASLSIAGLIGGVLNINIAQIDVPSGATCEVGEAGSSIDLTFLFAIQINVRGVFACRGNGGRIRIPGGNGDSSGINLFDGCRVDSIAAFAIQIFNRITGVNIGVSVTVEIGTVGPLFVFTTITGEIKISITGPGGEEVTTTSASTTTGPDSTPGLG